MTYKDFQNVSLLLLLFSPLRPADLLSSVCLSVAHSIWPPCCLSDMPTPTSGLYVVCCLHMAPSPSFDQNGVFLVRSSSFRPWPPYFELQSQPWLSQSSLLSSVIFLILLIIWYTDVNSIRTRIFVPAHCNPLEQWLTQSKCSTKICWMNEHVHT
jgi:hypothetical protein